MTIQLPSAMHTTILWIRESDETRLHEVSVGRLHEVSGLALSFQAERGKLAALMKKEGDSCPGGTGHKGKG